MSAFDRKCTIFAPHSWNHSIPKDDLHRRHTASSAIGKGNARYLSFGRFCCNSATHLPAVQLAINSEDVYDNQECNQKRSRNGVLPLHHPWRKTDLSESRQSIRLPRNAEGLKGNASEECGRHSFFISSARAAPDGGSSRRQTTREPSRSHTHQSTGQTAGPVPESG